MGGQYQVENVVPLLPSLYLAPVSYYVRLAQCGEVFVEQYENYQKQTLRNRCRIASPNGVLPLTIPIVKPETPKVLMRDTRISDHGNWRHLHWQALTSSYRRTPFFEFYADDFRPFYERKWEFLVDFNMALQETVCRLMDIDVTVTRTASYYGDSQLSNLNSLIGSAASLVEELSTFNSQLSTFNSPLPTPPYYQLFSDRHGFMADLSIVDLLFNMGPESILYLNQCNSCKKLP